MLLQLKDKIDREPDMVKVRCLYKQYKITTCDDTTYTYTVALQEFQDNPEETSDMDDGDKTIPKYGHNNPDEAAQFMEDVT